MKTACFAVLATTAVLCFVVGVHGKGDGVKTLSGNVVREENKCGENLYWELNEGTLTITGTGYMDDYSGSVHPPWYGNKSSITSVVIGEGVVSIGNSAFMQCQNLVNIRIGSNVTSIGADVFYRCTSLVSIYVEKNNTMFSVINGVLFSDNNAVLVQYPAGKTDTNYTIPDGVIKVEKYAFFQSHLANVIIPEGVTSIENYTFLHCESLVNVTLPESVISIGTQAFSSCSSLVNINLPSKLERIDDYAFVDCAKLEKITIPKSLQYIGDLALSTQANCLVSIDVEDGNQWFKSINGVLFNHNITEIVLYPPGKTDINYVIPESVKIIREGAFHFCQLVNITIPSGVKELEAVFAWCPNLSCVVIPEGVQSIASGAFSFCTNLGNVTIPASMNYIGGDSFMGCSNLKSVFYQGNTPMEESCSIKSMYAASFTDVCTPPGYTSNTFCGAQVTAESETCKTYQSFFTECTKGSCIDGVVVRVERDNVDEWTQQTSECVEYRCDAVNGFVSWNNCNTSDEVRRVCVNRKCIEHNSINEDWTVELEMFNVSLYEMNETEVLHILSNMTGITDMKIGTEVDDKGNVLRIIIYVKDETTANIVAETANELKKGEDNFFRKVVNVSVKCKSALLSNGHTTMVNVLVLLVVVLMTITV